KGQHRFPTLVHDSNFQVWMNCTGLLTHNPVWSVMLMYDVHAAGDPQVDAAVKHAKASALWKKYKPTGKDRSKLDTSTAWMLKNPVGLAWTAIKAIYGLMRNKELLQDNLADAMEVARPIGEGYMSQNEQDRMESAAALSDPATPLATQMAIAVQDNIDFMSGCIKDLGPFGAPQILKGKVAKRFKKHGEDPALIERAVDFNPTQRMNGDIAKLAIEAVTANTASPGLIPLLLSTPWTQTETEGEIVSPYVQGVKVYAFVESLEAKWPQFHTAMHRVMSDWQHRGVCEFDCGKMRLSEDPTSVLSTVVGMLKQVECDEGQGLDWLNLSQEGLAQLTKGEREWAENAQACSDAMNRISAKLKGRKRRSFHRDCAIMRQCG
ncbi:hypothetical protein KIPB_007984, partial [Kipferlia bialata]